MKKGFTTIEVIGALLALCIILTPLFNLTSFMFDNKLRDEYQDEEYNIAFSICEIFKSEPVNVNAINRQILLFIDDVNDLNTSVNDRLLAGNTIENTDFSSLSNLNISLKRYAVILKSYSWEKLSFLSVRITSMRKPKTELSLRIGL